MGPTTDERKRDAAFFMGIGVDTYICSISKGKILHPAFHEIKDLQLFIEQSPRRPLFTTLLLFVGCRFAPLEQINTLHILTVKIKTIEKMDITTITMPNGCRYMGEDNSLLSKLPLNGKFILNKTVTGCGGTSLFLNSNIPVVIISPRLHALKDKHEQHPDSFLFHVPYTNKAKRAEEITKLMSALNTYIGLHRLNPFSHTPVPPKVLVTLDSFGKVLDVLKSSGAVNDFLYVVDEFQCLMGDATFKGNTDMNFLIRLDNEVKSICYLSATPIPDIYLDYIPQFNGIPYIKLEWDPAVLEEPNVREIQMKKDESAEMLCSRIIQNFRAKGYFASKTVNGQTVHSTEACIFLNEVKSIRSIITKNNLRPDEVTILCSENKASGLPSGFKPGGLCTDRNNPVNKTFTFCTKASFEGVDFYSTNAITYVFINAGKEWQTLDIMLDIPQILGRQRLDTNPFRHDATVYYKTKPDCLSANDFKLQQQTMEQESEKFINDFNSASSTMKARLIKLVRDKAADRKFTDDYVDVLQVNGQATLGINHLVQVAKWNQWHQRSYYYSHSCQLTTSIQSAISMNVKPQEVKDFEAWYYSATGKDRLHGYSNFRNANPQHDCFILQNPFIDQRYHEWYSSLGYDTLASLNFDSTKAETAYSSLCSQAPIIQECRKVFAIGRQYTKPEVKQILQHIYNSFGLIGKTAKATDITQYLNVRERMITNSDGKRIEVYEIMP